MFQEPEKTTAEKEKTRLKEAAAGEGARGENSAAASQLPVHAGEETEKENPRPTISTPAKTRVSGSGDGHRLRIEKPSNILVAVIFCLFADLGLCWFFVLGPLLPTTVNFFIQRNQPETALGLIDSAKLFRSVDAGLLKQRAYCQVLTGDNQGALKTTEQIFSINDLSPALMAEAWARHGEANTNLGKNKDAQGDFKKAGDLDKDSARPFHERAYVKLTFTDQPVEAIKLEHIALDIDANLPKSYVNLSWADIRTGSYQQAVKDATTGLNLNYDWPKLPGVHALLLSNRAAAHYALNDLASCIKDATQSCDEEKSAPNQKDDDLNNLPFRNLMQAYLDNGQAQEALKVFETLPDSLKDDAILRAFQIEALAALKQKRPEEPPSEVDKDEAFKAFYADCEVYFKNKDYDHTLKAAARALNVKPEDNHALLMRARAYMGLKEYEKSAADLTLLLSRTEGVRLAGEAHLLRGLAYKYMGRTELGDEELKRAQKYGFSLDR